MIRASCDTFIAQAADGSQLFAKNSDRDPNEAHQIIYVPNQNFKQGSFVNCTYLTIPQVTATNAVLLCKPVWIWGAEMGVNQHGVVIGNEALFSKFAASKTPSLIGMDYVRLGLERGSTAREALEVITALLEQYGQGGNCGFDHKVYYHNTFMIVDRREAWVLETIHKHWIARKASRNGDSISNYPSITTQWDMMSDSLKAIVDSEQKQHRQFNFSTYCADMLHSHFGEGQKRMCRSQDCIARQVHLDVAAMISLCQDHGPSFLDERDISSKLTGQSLCMHSGFGPVRCNQTTCSLIVHLRDNGFTTWVTGTSAPCLSVFKPLLHISHLPQEISTVDSQTADDSLWWRHEKLHRLVLQDYSARAPIVKEATKLLQNEFLKKELEMRNQTHTVQQEWTRKCFEQSTTLDNNLADQLRSRTTSARPFQSSLYHMAWSKLTKRAKVNIEYKTSSHLILLGMLCATLAILGLTFLILKVFQ